MQLPTLFYRYYSILIVYIGSILILYAHTILIRYITYVEHIFVILMMLNLRCGNALIAMTKICVKRLESDGRIFVERK